MSGATSVRDRRLVTLTAPFRTVRAAQPVIKRYALEELAAGLSHFRKVVNISSIDTTSGNAGQVNYASAKAGVVGMTLALAKEWGRLNTNVNCVAFGPIGTRLTEAAADAGTVVQIQGRDIRVGLNPEVKATFERTTVRLNEPHRGREQALARAAG